MTTSNDVSKIWMKIVAKAWADEGYKARLMAAPAEVLAEEGVEIPAGMEFAVVESTPEKRWLVLPAMPEESSVIEGEERRAAMMCL